MPETPKAQRHLHKSRTRAVTQVCHPTDDPKDQYLIQHFSITCEDCGGTIEYHLIGHHIPVILRHLQKVMELYPDLCKETVMEVPASPSPIIIPNQGRPS